jgi:hypothetical protein
MKKPLYALLFVSCFAQGQAFDGAPSFTTRHAGTVHTLSLSHPHVDTKGIPSFDYVYEQRSGACQFRMAGHAEAMVEEVRGKSELVVFNPEDAKGRNIGQIVAYEGEDISFSLPYKEKLSKIGLILSMPPLCAHEPVTRAAKKV